MNLNIVIFVNMKILLWIVFVLLLLITICASVKPYANVTGDVTLGGLFPIHESNPDGRCGKIQPQDGIQALETVIFTLRRVNEDLLRDKNFTLGLLGMDTCESENVALENTLDMVVMDANIPEISLCWNQTRRGQSRKIVGVIGAALSKVSIAVASFLRLFKIPQVSYWSTAPELSDKGRFSYFKRTVPSDKYQALTIVNVLLEFRWTYVVAIYDKTPYSYSLFNEIERLVAHTDICFSLVEKIDSSKVSYDAEIEKLMTFVLDKKYKNMAGRTVVLLIAHFTMATKLFWAASRAAPSNKVYWVGVDAWSGRQFDPGLNHLLDGAVVVQPLGTKIEELQEHFARLKPRQRAENPWFTEFWEQHFNCTLPSKRNKGSKAAKETEFCDGAEKLVPENGFQLLPNLNFVQDSVLAFASAIRVVHDRFCGNKTGVCAQMREGLSSSLLDALSNVTFKDNAGKTFAFLNGTDGPAKYSVLQYGKAKGDNYDWTEIGRYMEFDGEYQLKIDPQSRYVPSVCSLPCQPDEERRRTRQCCWECRKCLPDEYVTVDHTCAKCPKEFVANGHHNACVAAPLDNISFSHPAGVALSFFASLGMVVCAIVGAIYYNFRSTPIIKAAGVELSAIILTGIFLSFASTFVFLAPPSVAVCLLTRMCLGLCVTMTYAAVTVKTWRICKIFGLRDNPGKMTSKDKRIISARSSLVITALLIGIELVGVVVWSAASVPQTSKIVASTDSVGVVLICEDSVHYFYLTILLWPGFLVGTSTVYAFKSRKTPDGYQETRFIMFSCITTVIICLAFIPPYLLLRDPKVKVVTLCLANVVNAWALLGLLFSRKVYIVVGNPRENTRERVMSRTTRSLSEIERSGDPNCTLRNRAGSTLSTSKEVAETRLHVSLDSTLTKSPLHLDEKTFYPCKVCHVPPTCKCHGNPLRSPTDQTHVRQNSTEEFIPRGTGTGRSHSFREMPAMLEHGESETNPNSREITGHRSEDSVEETFLTDSSSSGNLTQQSSNRSN